MDGEFSDPDVSAASSLVGKSDGRKHGPSKGSLPVSKLGNGSSAGSFLFDPASWLSMEQSSPLRTVVFGLGFFNNSYDAFVMSIVLVILSHAHDPPLRHLSTVAMATMSGVIAGQLVFGAVGPMIGRTRAFILTQCLVIAGALAAALTNASDPEVFVHQLVVARVVMGFGIGGEYPLSATLAADLSSSQSEVQHRGQIIGTSFAIQGVGCITAPLVVMSIMASLPGKHLDLLWRLALAFTALPGICLLYFRFQIREPESASPHQASPEDVDVDVVENGVHYQAEHGSGLPVTTAASSASASVPAASSSTASASAATASSSSFSLANLRRGVIDGAVAAAHKAGQIYDNAPLLLGTALPWFIMDLVFYGNAMFSARIFSEMSHLAHDASNDVVYDHCGTLARMGVLLGLFAIPGFFVGVRLIDIKGRRWLMNGGFFAMAVTFVCMLCLVVVFPAAAASNAGKVVFSVLYGLTFFFANAGPHLVTYVLAGEVFDKSVAPLMHGICSASGKLGALSGLFIFPHVVELYGMIGALLMCAGLCCMGGVVSYLFCLETMGKSTSSLSPHAAHGERKRDVQHTSEGLT